MSLVTITGQNDDFAVDGLAPKSGTPLSLRGSGFTHLVVSLCFPILLYFSMCLSISKGGFRQSDSDGDSDSVAC